MLPGYRRKGEEGKAESRNTHACMRESASMSLLLFFSLSPPLLTPWSAVDVGRDGELVDLVHMRCPGMNFCAGDVRLQGGPWLCSQGMPEKVGR